jgi:catechol-2,3-dioxygenase
MLDGFAELTLQAREREALERFYTQVLGLDVLSREDDRTWLRVGEGARLGLWTPGEKELGDEGGTHVHYAYSVAPRALDALAARLRGQGVEVDGPREHDGGDRSIYFEDPEGNVVEAWDFFGRGRDVEELRG